MCTSLVQSVSRKSCRLAGVSKEAMSCLGCSRCGSLVTHHCLEGRKAGDHSVPELSDADGQRHARLASLTANRAAHCQLLVSHFLGIGNPTGPHISSSCRLPADERTKPCTSSTPYVEPGGGRVRAGPELSAAASGETLVYGNLWLANQRQSMPQHVCWALDGQAMCGTIDCEQQRPW